MNKGLARRGGIALDVRSKLILLLFVAIAYGSNFWPGEWWRSQLFRWLGEPEYAGFRGLFLPHLLAYVTMTAIVCALLWALLAKARLVVPPRFALDARVAWLGAAGGFAALLLSLLTVWLVAPEGTIGWIEPDGWTIAANLVSNFYEEWIFRGFLLVALTVVIGFWPAAVVASAMWAWMHPQFPLPMQLMLTVIGVGWCWISRESKSLWAPYFAHMSLDVVADSLIA